METHFQQHQSAQKYTGSKLRCIPLITKIEVRNIVKSLKYKSCLLDPPSAFYLKGYDMFQSAYRPNHNTENALVKIFNYISLSLSTKRMWCYVC